MTNIRAVLASNMKSRRKDLNLSQANLAEKIGSSPNYISKIEAEKQFPSVQMIEQIAAALDFDTLDLFSAVRLKKDKLQKIQNELCRDITALISRSFDSIEES